MISQVRGIGDHCVMSHGHGGGQCVSQDSVHHMQTVDGRRMGNRKVSKWSAVEFALAIRCRTEALFSDESPRKAFTMYRLWLVLEDS